MSLPLRPHGVPTQAVALALSSVWSALYSCPLFWSELLPVLQTSPQVSPPQRGLPACLVYSAFPQTLPHHLSLLSVQPYCCLTDRPQFVILYLMIPQVSKSNRAQLSLLHRAGASAEMTVQAGSLEHLGAGPAPLTLRTPPHG